MLVTTELTEFSNLHFSQVIDALEASGAMLSAVVLTSPRVSNQSDPWRNRAVVLDRRLRQFYRHRYGDRSPHRGGQDILLLGCEKRVIWAAVDDRHQSEDRLIESFCAVHGRRPFGNRVRSARNLRGSGS